jgi:hypothetical protein
MDFNTDPAWQAYCATLEPHILKIALKSAPSGFLDDCLQEARIAVASIRPERIREANRDGISEEQRAAAIERYARNAARNAIYSFLHSRKTGDWYSGRTTWNPDGSRGYAPSRLTSLNYLSDEFGLQVDQAGRVSWVGQDTDDFSEDGGGDSRTGSGEVPQPLIELVVTETVQRERAKQFKPRRAKAVTPVSEAERETRRLRTIQEQAARQAGLTLEAYLARKEAERLAKVERQRIAEERNRAREVAPLVRRAERALGTRERLAAMAKRALRSAWARRQRPRTKHLVRRAERALATRLPRYPGVYLHGGRYRAMLRRHGKLRHIGCYDGPEEAASVFRVVSRAEDALTAS